MSLLSFTIALVIGVWSVFGAVAVACFQDALRTSDDRDPMIVDLPRWQIAICGPIAWALYALGRMRQ